MSEFEVLLVPVSLILGLGVTKILDGIVSTVRHRRLVRPHWLPLTWAASILLYLILYFNVLFDLSQRDTPWTWLIYGSVLFQSMLLFLGAALVFPDSQFEEKGMRADFDENGKLALVPIGLLLATGPLLNRLQYHTPWLSRPNVLNAFGTLLIVFVFSTRRRAMRAGLAVAFAALTVIGVFLVWAQPGT